MLSPESATKDNVPYDNATIESCYSGEVTRASSPVEADMPRGIDGVDPRLCQSTTSLSILSRYKMDSASHSRTASAKRRLSEWTDVWPNYKLRRSSHNQSTKSGLRRRIATTLNREISGQSFSDQQKRTLSGFSSVNYSPTHSIAFIRWLGEQKRRFYTRLELDRWLLLMLIGLCIGLVATLLKQSIEALGAIRWERTKSYLQDGKVAEGYWSAAGIGVAYVVISSFLVTFIHPPAAGGGTPEVIAFLNGIIVHGSLSLKNLVVKFTANVFAVSSGLPAAIQAPIITYGAIVGAGVGQFKSKTLGIHPNIFTRFRNAADRREFTTAGVAAGVSAGFHAPIGGLLFAMEDLSSFWTKTLSWQTFFCCVIAGVASQVFNIAFEGFNFQGVFGAFNVQKVQPIQMHLATLIPALLMGVVGGLLAALFTRLNTRVCKYRTLLLAKIQNNLLKRLARMLETIVLVMLMACYSVFLPLGFSCRPAFTGDDDYRPANSEYDAYIPDRIERISKHSTFNCPESPNTNTTFYNPMATLIQGSGTSYLAFLWSRNTHYLFDYDVCLAAFVIYFFMIIWTAGTAIAGGVFVPVLVSGSLYGRAFGVGLCHMWRSITGTPYPTGTWKWIDPGVMAAVGAAGLLGGVNRIATASTVIVMEMVGDISLVIPNLIAIFVSKMVADQLSKPLFKCQLESKALPQLDPEPNVIVAGKTINMELCRASDVMTASPDIIYSQENVAKLAKMLLRTGHSGFPVVKYDEETRTEVAYGLITRVELYVILCSDDVYRQETPGTIVYPFIPYEELSVDYIADKTAAEERIRMYARFKVYAHISVDLESFINISVPKVDKDYSLYRTYVIFRTLGLRHLVVVDVHNHVVGLITRKDVMPFKMQERLESLLEQTTTLNPDLEYGFKTDEPKKSMDSGKGSSYSDKPARLSDASNQSGDATLPAITKTPSATSISKSGPDEEEAEVQSMTSAVADAEVGDDRADSDSPPAVVVTISPPDDDDDNDDNNDDEDRDSDSSIPVVVTISPPDDDDNNDDNDDDDDDDVAFELQRNDNEVDPAGPASAAADEDDEGRDSDASIPVVVTVSPPDDNAAPGPATPP